MPLQPTTSRHEALDRRARWASRRSSARIRYGTVNSHTSRVPTTTPLTASAYPPSSAAEYPRHQHDRIRDGEGAREGAQARDGHQQPGDQKLGFVHARIIAPLAPAKPILLAAAMAFLALNVWTGSPLLAVWLGSRV